jgi:hypothetical protein
LTTVAVDANNARQLYILVRGGSMFSYQAI